MTAGLSATTVYALAHAGWGALIAFVFAWFGHPWVGVAVSEMVCMLKAAAWDSWLEGSPLSWVWVATWPWQVGIISSALIFLVK